MTNWCVAFVSGTLLLAFCSCAYSLQCYQCAEASVSDCDKDQTLVVCKNPSFHCATAMFTKASGETYTKKCFPLPVVNNYCTETNKSLGPIFNCSISSCDRDYCNGPTPTTPTVPTTMMTSRSTENMTTQESTTASKETNVKSGSPSTSVGSSTLGIMIIALALYKILNIYSVS